jgi:hypothetical protein
VRRRPPIPYHECLVSRSRVTSCFGFPAAFEKLLNRNTKSVRDLHQGPHRGITAPQFQIPQIAPLHGRTLGQLLLGPALRLAEHSDALRQQPQDLGFGYGQPSSFRNGRVGFVRSELQSLFTSGFFGMRKARSNSLKEVAALKAMHNWHRGSTCFLSVILALSSCNSPAQKQNSESKPATPRFAITKMDAGPLTTYAPGTKGLTKQVVGTSLHRTSIILNDPSSPVEIVAFGLDTSNRTLSSQPCTAAEQLTDPMSWNCAKLMYDLTWSLRARSSVSAWEVHNSVYDVMNRFLWADKSANDAQGSDAGGLEPGSEHKTERVSWWNSTQAANLSKWVTSIVYVAAVRTKDGAVWKADKEALRGELRSMSFEPPEELK